MSRAVISPACFSSRASTQHLLNASRYASPSTSRGALQLQVARRRYIQPKAQQFPLGRRHFSSTRRGYSSERGNRQSNEQNQRNWGKLPLTVAVGAVPLWMALDPLLDASGLNDTFAEWTVGRPLNDRSFVPFTIVSRDQVSPTSFVLTVKPKFSRDGLSQTPVSGQENAFYQSTSTLFRLPRFLRQIHTNKPVLEKAWSHGLWSVEIKQPQIQVARDYTPLPTPTLADEAEDLERGYLRFLIRRMDGGEVSTYLSGLQVGDTIELRGPHLGFDIRARLGTSEWVVFLAGGTGIAPALQTARALLDGGVSSPTGKSPSVSIVWANRHRADCPDCPDVSTLSANQTPQSAISQLQSNGNSSHPIMSCLSQLKNRHPDNLHYTCTVDDEGTFISASTIARETSTVSPSSSANPRRSAWKLNLPGFKISVSTAASVSTSDLSAATSAPSDSTLCSYHSDAILRSTGQGDPSASSSTTLANDNGCRCKDAQGRPVAGGKDLLMVSGPDGFITYLVGAKTWGNGLELQGAIGGLVGGMKKRDPETWREWLVLKL